MDLWIAGLIGAVAGVVFCGVVIWIEAVVWEHKD